MVIITLIIVTIFCDIGSIHGTAIDINRNGDRNLRFDASGNTDHSTTINAAVMTKPASRDYNCFLQNNIECDVSKVKNSVGFIIGSSGFPEKGPRDTRTANGDNPSYYILDQDTISRRYPSHFKIEEYNETHFSSEIIWTFNGEATIDTINVFLSDSSYTNSQPTQRSVLNFICSYGPGYNIRTRRQSYEVQFDCYIPNDFIKELLYGSHGFGVLVSALRIVGNDHTFHQISDISLHKPEMQIINYHGFVSEPASRAKLCQLRINKNCGPVMYEPQSVEGFKAFPYGSKSPPDGKIASGNNPNFNKLNEYGKSRWYNVPFPEVRCLNGTHVYFNLTWYFTATHSTDSILVFISNEKYTSNELLSRHHLDLNPICSMRFYGKHPPASLTLQCPITMDKYQQLQGFNELLLLNVWNINDTAFAFYQVVDLQRLSVNQALENIRNKC